MYSGVYSIIKRGIDIVGSLIALVIFSPFCVYIMYKIKREDGGPILYKQERIGLDGRPFMMWKFRSMVVGAHAMKDKLLEDNESDGPIFKIKDDPRITKIGQWIRKHSLDEIPQFFNILKGDMSLVGPRPALPEEVEAYSTHDRERLRVVPGLTGLWQVSGRSNLTYEEMIDLDLEYVKRHGVLTDLKILLMTLWLMVDTKHSGAY